MNKDHIFAKIESAFPFIDKPDKENLAFHSSGCYHCDAMGSYLSSCTKNPLSGDVIRYLHQEMSCLSPDGWCWVLPSYLRFCLTDEAAYNQMETEFLIYNLSPKEKYKKDTIQHLSKLNNSQISCLYDFLVWCSQEDHWASSYCPDEIKQSMQFVADLRA